MTLSDLVRVADAQAKLLGWRDPPPTPAEACALIHSEVSEVLEELRQPKLRIDERVGDKPVGVASELADVVIRTVELAAMLDVDLEAAVAAKLTYNATRTWRHGGKRL